MTKDLVLHSLILLCNISVPIVLSRDYASHDTHWYHDQSEDLAPAVNDVDESVMSYLITLFASDEAYGYESLEYIRHKDHEAYLDILAIHANALQRIRIESKKCTWMYVSAVAQQEADRYVSRKIDSAVHTYVHGSYVPHAVATFERNVSSSLHRKFRELQMNEEKFKGDYAPFIGRPLSDAIHHECDELYELYLRNWV